MIQIYAQTLFFKKEFGNSFSTTFYAWYFKKDFSQTILYQLTKFHCLIAFTYWDIWRYVHCSCLFPRLWCHEFSNQSYIFLIKPFYCMTKKSRFENKKILRTKIAFKVKWKAFLIIFKGLSVAKNCLIPKSALLTTFAINLHHRWLTWSSARLWLVTSSCWQILLKTGVLFAISARKQLCRGVFSIELHVWKASNFIKKRRRYRCFPANIAKFLRTTFL